MTTTELCEEYANEVFRISMNGGRKSNERMQEIIKELEKLIIEEYEKITNILTQ